MVGRPHDSLEGGPVALVTGAASGIGRATAIAFASAGARVVVSDIALESGAETVDMIRAAGGTARFMRADVARSDDVNQLIESVTTAFGRLDWALNNAGIVGFVGPFLEYPDDVFDRVLAVNVGGVWNACKAEIPVMLEQGAGSIVNLASAAGLRGSPSLSGYAASKHAVVGLTKSLAREFSGHGVRINCVCPGVIDTPMTQSAFSAEMMASAAARQGGRLGTPEEVADAVVWLCSAGASYVHGVTLPVDGALLA